MTKNKKIKELIKYMEEINRGNYSLDINDMSEGALSILKSEIYKTTVMLKEQAENSTKDKLKLKDSLSDISHQLKTPLTSILIMVDDMIDNEDMDKETRIDFLNDIKREISSINFLVQSILTLSRFDANAIDFINKKVKVRELIEKAVTNIETLCDLKDIKVKVKCNNQDTLICDFNWQVEAITNIIKNCVEHSHNNSIVEINEVQNKVYTLIEIKDYGIGIDEEDLPHIFERFYKGKNSNKNSIGIGLALSKTIIEENNGKIDVSSSLNQGTTFKIKYLK